MKQAKAFSIIEVLIVLAIIFIIVGISAYSTQNWRKQVNLINTRDSLKSTLTKAQQLAASSSQTLSWGVHLESDRYVFFKGDTYDPDEVSNIITYLKGTQIINPATSLSDGVSGYSPEVIFAKLSGETVNIGTITITVLNDIDSKKEIIITKTGAVN